MRDDDLNGKNGVGTSSSSPPTSFAEGAAEILYQYFEEIIKQVERKEDRKSDVEIEAEALTALTALHVADCERIIPEKQYNLGLPGMYRAAYNKAIDEMRQRLEAQK